MSEAHAAPLPLFDGDLRKTDGQAAVEENNQVFVRTMRTVAMRISEERGMVTSDDLRLEADRLGLTPTHVNAWGAVWIGKGWEVIGHKKSALPSSHAREIKIFRWIGNLNEGG